MSYRKLGVVEQHRRSMLANLTIELIMNEAIVTTDQRAKEAKKQTEKMITYIKKGTLVNRRKAYAFLYNRSDVVKKLDELAIRYKDRNGGYTRIIKIKERRGDDALMVKLELV